MESTVFNAFIINCSFGDEVKEGAVVMVMVMVICIQVQ